MDLIDQHLDAVLHASGSALRHYTMQKSLDDMRAAMQAAMAAVPADELRPRFETWVRARPGHNDLMSERRPEGKYADPVVEFAWQAVLGVAQ